MNHLARCTMIAICGIAATPLPRDIGHPVRVGDKVLMPCVTARALCAGSTYQNASRAIRSNQVTVTTPPDRLVSAASVSMEAPSII